MAQTLQKTIEINGTLTSGFDFGKDKVHGSFCQSFGYNTGVSAKFLKSTTVHRKLLRRDSVPFAKGTEPLVNLVQFTGRVLWGGEVHGGLFWQLSFVCFAGLGVAELDVAGLGVVVVVVEVVRNWASVAVVAVAYQRGRPPLHC